MAGRAGCHPLLPQLQQADIHLTRDDRQQRDITSTPAGSGDLGGTCYGKQQQLTVSELTSSGVERRTVQLRTSKLRYGLWGLDGESLSVPALGSSPRAEVQQFRE